MRVIVCTLCALLAVSIGTRAAAADDLATKRKPNLIIILSDDQGYGDLSCYGSKTIRTPNIDRLARDGARLTTFYAAAPICTPTRAALMTGRLAKNNLATPLHVPDNHGLEPRAITLAEGLQDQGYHTACIGKWHLGHKPDHYPTRHGFDFYFGTPMGHMFNRPAIGKAIGDTSDLFLRDEQPIPFPPNEDLTEAFTTAAVKFIDTHANRPFFLFLAHSMPHEPLAVSKRFAGKSEGGLYGDVIECIDWSTGQVLEALSRNGLTENTVVVFTSDNGPKRGHGSACPLRGFKHQPYEGGVRVPCVIRGPALIKPGLEIDSITNIMDLYPTFLTYAGSGGVPKVRGYWRGAWDGQDISQLLAGAKEAKPVHNEFYYVVRHGVPAGVRQGRWKLLEQANKNPELYDLEADLAETKNLADKFPKIVKTLQTRLARFEVIRLASDYRSGPKRNWLRPAKPE
jgi:arylsulfatase A